MFDMVQNFCDDFEWIFLLTSGIRAEVTGLNPKGVAEEEIVGRSEGWPRPSTPFVFAMGAWVNAL